MAMTKKAPRPAIGTWYRADFGYSPRVMSRPIVSVTDKTIFYLEACGWNGTGPTRERREDRHGGGYLYTHCWYPTFEEAKARVVSEFKKKVQLAEINLAKAEAIREETNG